MDYRKTLYLIIIFDFLILVLLTAISFRFLSGQIKKTKQVRPEILAQYNIVLEVSRFLKLKTQLEGVSGNP